MPTLQDVLVKQAAVPATFESNLPSVAPKVSEILTNIAGSLPVNPQLPEIPVFPEGSPPQEVINVIEGIPDLPEIGEFPTLPVPTGGGGNGGTTGAGLGMSKKGFYRPLSGLGATTPIAGAGRVMGGGYRSI